MLHRLRQLLVVLIAFAFTGGAAFQFAQAAEYVAPSMMAGIPCGMMMSHAGATDEMPMPPCKGLTSDCIKQMGCISDAALPVRTVDLDMALNFSDVDYWSAWSELADFMREPEPLPPRTI